DGRWGGGPWTCSWDTVPASSRGIGRWAWAKAAPHLDAPACVLGAFSLKRGFSGRGNACHVCGGLASTLGVLEATAALAAQAQRCAGRALPPAPAAVAQARRCAGRALPPAPAAVAQVRRCAGRVLLPAPAAVAQAR